MTSKNRVFGLDVIRATAICFVMIAHSVSLLNPLKQLPNVFGKFADVAIKLTYPFGTWGVELFFVLSGFLIGKMMIDIFTSDDKYNFAVVKLFWIRRWLRTLPNYYVFLFINSVLSLYISDLKFDWHYLFFIQNFSKPHPHFFGEAWSLSVEEWSYLTIPLALLLFSYFLRKHGKQKILLYLILFYLAVFSCIRFINAFSPMFADQDSGIRRVVLFRLDATIYGLSMAYFRHYFPVDFHKFRKPLFIYGVICLIVFSFLNYLGFKDGFDYFHTSSMFRFCSNAFFFTFLPLFSAMLLPLAASIVYAPKKLWAQFVIHVSLVSYSIYLCHYSLIELLFFERFEQSNPILAVSLFVSYFIVVISVSTVVHKKIELPFLKLRDRIC